MLVAVFAVGASAYDFLYTGDTAMTHDAGAFGVSGGLMYFMADEYYDKDGEAQELGVDWTAMWIPIHVYYAAMDNMEFGVNAKFGMLKLTPDEGEDVEGSGLGDTWIWAKYMFLPEPMVSARLGLKVNTGSEACCPELGFATGFFGTDEDDDIATGQGQMDIDGAIMIGVPAGPGQFDAAVGYRYRMAQEVSMDARDEDTWDFIPGSEIHFAAGYTYYISDMMNFGIAADGFFGSEAEWETSDDSGTFDDSAANAVWINPSFEYMMETGLTLGVDMQYMLMGQNAPVEWGFGAFVGWGM
jgi:hypothetical protein